MKLLLSVVLVCFLWPVAISAQSAEELTDIGNNLYRDKKYQEAIASYTRAIQLQPDEALRAYRNMARAYNKLEAWSASAQYYLWYLELAPDASDRRKIKAELDKVERRLKDAAPNALTDAQEKALERFETTLKIGPYLTAEGGGALPLFEVLLRTGYAAPALARHKEQLARGLLGETRFALRPSDGQVVPALERELWKLAQERVMRAAELQGKQELSGPNRALVDGAAGWEEYAMGNYDRARERFRLALEADAKLLVAHWGLVMATFLTDSKPYVDTLTVLDAAEAVFAAEGRTTHPLFPMMRGLVLKNAGRPGDAAALFLEAENP